MHLAWFTTAGGWEAGPPKADRVQATRGFALLSLVLTRSSSRVWSFSTISAPDLGRPVHPGAGATVNHNIKPMASWPSMSAPWMRNWLETSPFRNRSGVSRRCWRARAAVWQRRAMSTCLICPIFSPPSTRYAGPARDWRSGPQRPPSVRAEPVEALAPQRPAQGERFMNPGAGSTRSDQPKGLPT